jgi:hypothetical protein
LKDRQKKDNVLYKTIPLEIIIIIIINKDQSVQVPAGEKERKVIPSTTIKIGKSILILCICACKLNQDILVLCCLY